jgi:hypothetical protein
MDIVIEERRSRSQLLNLAGNRALRELRRRYYKEYYEIYEAELDKLGVKRSSIPYQARVNNHLANENARLKELLAQAGVEF